MRRKVSRGNTLVLIVGILTLLVSSAALLFSTMTWLSDQEEKYRQSQPHLSYVQDSAKYDGGYLVLTLENQSPVTPAAITGIVFAVTDPDSLARIERKEPIPQGMVPMKTNESDDVVFTEGEWVSSDRYEFYLRHSFHVPPSDVNNLRLAIVNRKWAGQEFTGELEIQYTGDNTPLPLSPVTIRGRSKK